MDALNARRIGPGDGTSEEAWLAWPQLQKLPAISLEELAPPMSRVLVVAPHPDDEVLLAGGLLASLASLAPIERELCVIAVTDGTASHTASLTWPAARLARERPLESERALASLGIRCAPLRLELPDGGLAESQDQLRARLEQIVRPTDTVITTWRSDGHPDHEATARACCHAAARCGARLFEAPVWAWHWALPEGLSLPWDRAFRLGLSSAAVERKLRALQSFESQLSADPSTGARPVIGPSMLQRARRRFEVFLR